MIAVLVGGAAMRRILISALAALAPLCCSLGATNADASALTPQATLPATGQPTKPEWVAIPSGDDMAKVYPDVALRLSLPGAASIKCIVDTDGKLQDCQIVKESPPGFGFGAAALRLAPDFKMKPAVMDGRPVEAVLTIPIRFELAGQTIVASDMEPPPPPPTSPSALDLARQVLALQGVSARLKAQSQPAVAHLLSEIVRKGDIAFDGAAMNALQQGLDDVVQNLVDHQARMMAAAMTEAQLRATLDYLQSPAGTAWRAVGVTVTPPSDLLSRVGEAASKHLCGSVSCHTGG
jgi:TonB family protein